MTFLFFDDADKILFSRNDAEQAEYTHEQMSLYMLFPYDPNKVIQRGMRVGYKDNLGVFQVFEIRQCKEYEPDHYQEITAEHICISELTDEIKMQGELTDITARAALTAVLANTQWSVGTSSVSNLSSLNIGLGNVWADIRSIEQNWNVYITPRVTVSPTGITGRYLDITSTAGVWRGIRLSVDKNMDEVGVTLDDSNLKTACYGFGKMVTEPPDEEDLPQMAGLPDAAPYPLIVNPYEDEPDLQEFEKFPLTFAKAEWTQTAQHPAKPLGQIYVEDPAATETYGRNGRARFTFYQNGDIDDPDVLLQKTWEYLQTVSVPAVSIDSTVQDLSRLGKIDVPLRLHDIAQIEIRPTGRVIQRQIIKLVEDLLNPGNNHVTIGDNIPNIIYINREIAEKSGAGGGGGGNSKFEEKIKEFETEIMWNDYEISLRAYQRDMDRVSEILRQAGISISANGVIIYAEDNENMVASKLSVLADRITTEVTDRSNADALLSSRITQTADSITSEVERATSAESALGASISTIRQTADAVSIEVANARGDSATLSARLTVLQNGIDTEVQNRTSADTTMLSRITQTESNITSLVTKTGVNSLGESETLFSLIDQNADGITSLVAKTGVNSLGQGETLYSKISQTATEVSSKVSAGDIASTINQTAQSVLIQAGKIDLQGYVTASDLAATNATISNLTSGATTAQSLKTHLLSADTGFTYQGSTISKNAPSLATGLSASNNVLSDGAIDLWHYHEITATEDNGVITISLGGATRSASDRSANFNIADTAFYQNAVSAAKAEGAAGVTMSAGGWTGGANTVTASNGGTLILSAPTIAVDSSQYVSGRQYSIAVDVGGANQNLVISAQDAYNEGKSSVSVPVLLVQNENYLNASKEYEMDVYAELSNGVTRTGYAVIDASEAYAAGWAAGAAGGGSVSISQPTWNAGFAGSSNTFSVTATTSGGATDTLTHSLYLTHDTSWASGTMYAYLRSNSSGGTRHARVAVNMPDSGTFTCASRTGTQYGIPISMTFTAGGKTYSGTGTI